MRGRSNSEERERRRCGSKTDDVSLETPRFKNNSKLTRRRSLLATLIVAEGMPPVVAHLLSSRSGGFLGAHPLDDDDEDDPDYNPNDPSPLNPYAGGFGNFLRSVRPPPPAPNQRSYSSSGNGGDADPLVIDDRWGLGGASVAKSTV